MPEPGEWDCNQKPEEWRLEGADRRVKERKVEENRASRSSREEDRGTCPDAARSLGIRIKWIEKKVNISVYITGAATNE